MAIFGLLATIVVLMGLSRMILGVHFLDQVILGYFLGIMTLFFVKFVIWPNFVENIQYHKEKGKDKPEILKDLLIFLALNMTFFLTNFAIFQYVVYNNWFEIDPQYL